MTKIRLRVNGKAVVDDVPPRLSLADFLRERRNLTGTHLGCEHGVCGACTILIDGEPARSCLAFAVACEGRDIRTIEGFEDDHVMVVLRQAFHQHHGLQCGFCTPAMLITARDVIARNRAGSDKEIRKELAGNICRCTGYTNIVTAISAAAAALKGAPVRSAQGVATDSAGRPLPIWGEGGGEGGTGLSVADGNTPDRRAGQ
jgi:aerobic carbon-monoxide dehydrogenase small subunit